MIIPGFTEWLDYRGKALFPGWQTREVFNTSEVFIKFLGKVNYHHALRRGMLPLPDGFKKGRWLWSKAEAEKLWHWAYENGWFSALPTS